MRWSGGVTGLDRGPQDPAVYHVYQLCYGRVRNRRVHDNFMRRDIHDGPMPLDFNVWIVRNAHRTLLVDTGFSRRAAAERGRPIDLDPMEALARLGVPPESVDDAVLTHLHFDHAGNLDRLKRARFHVQDREVAFATGRCMCHAALRGPFDVEDVTNLIRCTFAERVQHHDGTAHPFPGISLHALPGHSKGLQSVLVATERGNVLLASDAAHYYANLCGRAPFALTVDADDTLRSYEAMLRLVPGVDHIIPGHDPLVREFYPTVTVNGVELTVLHAQPKSHDHIALAEPRLAEFETATKPMADA